MSTPKAYSSLESSMSTTLTFAADVAGSSAFLSLPPFDEQPANTATTIISTARTTAEIFLVNFILFSSVFCFYNINKDTVKSNRVNNLSQY